MAKGWKGESERHRMAQLNRNAFVGFQFYSENKAKSYLKYNPNLKVVSVKKPKWWYGEKWKTLYALERK